MISIERTQTNEENCVFMHKMASIRSLSEGHIFLFIHDSSLLSPISLSKCCCCCCCFCYSVRLACVLLILQFQIMFMAVAKWAHITAYTIHLLFAQYIAYWIWYTIWMSAIALSLLYTCASSILILKIIQINNKYVFPIQKHTLIKIYWGSQLMPEFRA